MNVDDAAFLSLLAEATDAAVQRSLRGGYDRIFVQVNEQSDLARISKACKHLRPDGALWVLHPKGKNAAVKDAQVREAYLACGLVDNKVSAYNETHTATRCVIPVAARRPSR